MKFSEIYIEKDIANHAQVSKIVARFPTLPVHIIDRYDRYFGRVKKPYLHKRVDTKLYLAHKKGQLIKEAPDAYGLSGEPHYYFIHAYNCIYECQYCYLQGYFNSPDIVLFVNHDEILCEIEKAIKSTQGNIWFHAGEFSDSLALSHLSGELPIYFDFFQRNPRAKLELRTKSVNVKELLTLTPSDNIYVSYSLSPQMQAKQFDLSVPNLAMRLKAIKQLKEKKFQIALHFDPIIYTPNILKDYQELFVQVLEHIKAADIAYISLGVVRFTKDVYQQVKKNYPESLLALEDFETSFDNKVRYPQELRLPLLHNLKQQLLKLGFLEQQIYLCMEQEDVALQNPANSVI